MMPKRWLTRDDPYAHMLTHVPPLCHPPSLAQQDHEEKRRTENRHGDTEPQLPCPRYQPHQTVGDERQYRAG